MAGETTCICFIDYEDGTLQVGIHSLEGNLVFSLEEMEKWVAEQSEKAVRKVRCYKVKKE